jgi:hypothetical protein
MPVVATRFERSAPRRVSWANGARRLLRELLGALDRLVPAPNEIPRDAQLPPEWFKYPPI